MLLVVALLFATPALFTPWIYFAGGHWHALPQWQGAGRFTANGREYALFVRMIPRPSGPPYLSTTLGGNAVLCTPDGRRLSLALRGGMAKHLPLDLRGQAVSLEVYRTSVWAPWRDGNYQTEGRPTLQFKSTWGDRVIDAHGFLLLDGDASRGFKQRQKIPVSTRLNEASNFVLWPECPALGSAAAAP
jgi:hypothetical protein